MSLNIALHAGLSGVLTHQKQVEVTGNNIANVNTPGYSRQTLSVSPGKAIDMNGLLLGQGVDAETVNREYDKFVSGQLVEQGDVLGREEAKSSPLAEIERIMGIGEDSLASEIEGFFGAWHDLSANPGGSVERDQVIYKGENLLDSFSQLESGLVDVRRNINDSLNAEVNGINLKLQKVAELNASIKDKQSLGHVANTDLDERDVVVKELSELLGVQTFETGQGQVGLQLPGGVPLVQGNRAMGFEGYYEGGNLQIQIRSGDVVLETDRTNFGGKFRGLMELRDQFIPELEQDLDDLRHGIVTNVNAQHEAGYDLDGNTGRSFFTRPASVQSETGFADPAALTLDTGEIEINDSTITIDAQNNSLYGIRDAINDSDAGVIASVVHDGTDYHLDLTPKTRGADVESDFSQLSDFIDEDTDGNFFDAAGSEQISVAVDSTDQVAAAGFPEGAPGDNVNAMAIHELNSSKLINGDQTFVDAYGRIAATVGTETRRNTMARQGAADTMDQLENLRESMVGVSLEQEMINLTLFQRGFEASSRFVQTIDEMMGTLIGLKR
ncbi:flagellar hook-associated protein 1 FlgK [Desulfosalsimonas propionicica]|uniref:Flagellar hook-associated protein 1 n=1 Tax=Desulfosalsimonas propionicica TaxID=332175 RepID=A0A7W0HKI9_9BACT|nr:flagellar hook-associated protein FlgK [Desulfosalsimonas propionicica]MBA2881329.1 flagellar hook-associated protein 1 FlgK [Desulfosalsimonas propionicica]